MRIQISERGGKHYEVSVVQAGVFRSPELLRPGDRHSDSGHSYEELQSLGPGEHEIRRKIEIEVRTSDMDFVDVRAGRGPVAVRDQIFRGQIHPRTGLSFDELRSLGDGFHWVMA